MKNTLSERRKELFKIYRNRVPSSLFMLMKAQDKKFIQEAQEEVKEELDEGINTKTGEGAWERGWNCCAKTSQELIDKVFKNKFGDLAGVSDGN